MNEINNNFTGKVVDDVCQKVWYSGEPVNNLDLVYVGHGFNNLEDFKNLPGGVFATVDLCHLATLSNDLVKEMEKIAPIIKEIHFNDGKTGSDGFEGGLVPGEGDISIRVFKEEITPFLKKLSDVNIVIEVLREDFISSDNSKKTLEKLAKWLDIF